MSNVEDQGNGRVSFTVKELLGNLDKKIDKFVDALEHKADVVRLEQTEKNVEELDVRVQALEDSAADQASVDAYRKTAESQRKADRKWLIALALTTCVGVLAIGANVIYTLVK
jgi:hypothetical protein